MKTIIQKIASFNSLFFIKVKKKQNARSYGFLAMFVLLFSLHGNGQTLLQWNTFGNTGTETTEPSTTNNANIAAATLNFTGSGVVPAANGNRFGGTPWAVGVLSTTKYIQFTVTPNAGYSFTPTSFSFIWDFSSTGPKSVALRSSADNYAANLGSIATMTTSTSTVRTITISGLTNITTATTFRLYGYDATATTGTGGFDCAVSANNVILYGTTASTGPVPTISTTGSLSALSTTYGTPSTTSTFSVSGANMTAGIKVKSPTGFEVSDNNTTGFLDSIVIGATGTISSTPVYIRLKQTATFAGSPYSGNITLSSTGASNVTVATASSTVSKLAVTVSGATASNKIYDGNTTASIAGASISTVNSDVITVNGGGVFADKNVGTAKSITSNLTLSGTNASSYALTQPTLTANITAKELTIVNAVAQNKVYDGTTSTNITGTLSGIISPDVVTFNGTGNFVSSGVGTAIAVTSNSTLGGADAGNYSLTQPTGLSAEITPAGLATQTITFALSSPVTYGAAPIVLGGTTTSSLTVTYTSSNPAVASISNDTLTILSNGTVTITASQAGDGTTYEPALNVVQNLIINQKELTIQNALGQNKIYDRTNAATFTGSLNGIVGTDVVTLNSVGTFSQATIGTGLTITPAATLSGADAAKYTLVQPTGLSANITAKELTILTPVVKNKLEDGTTTATLTGTLNGVISPDVVTLSLSAAFASAAAGNSIAVTSTSIVGGADASNYTLTQPTGLTANIYAQPTLVEEIMPQYIQGVNGTNNNRLPYVFRATINNLLPNATYRYYNLADTVNGPIANSAGIFILPSASGNFTSVSTPGMTTAGTYGTLTASATGSYTGWFIMQTSGNARFVPGKDVNMKILLNDGEGGTAITSRLVSTQTAKIINLGTTSSTTLGSGLRGSSNGIAKNMVFAYDNMNGTGRPISGSYVESAGLTLTSTATFYTTSVQGVAGAYGMIIPNVNANGIQLIQQLDYTTAALVGCGKDADGIWAGGANTVNPTSGTTAKVLTVNDAPLNSCCTPTTSSTNLTICNSLLPYSWNTLTITSAGTYTYSTTNAGGCDSTATLNLTVNQTTSLTVNQTKCSSELPYTWNGQSLTATGTYTDTRAGSNGCDSVTTLNLTVNQTTSSTVNQTKCSSELPYTWNGQSLTAAGTYSDTRAGSNGCDSVTTLNLTVNQTTSSTLNQTKCSSELPYTWNGQSLTAAGTYTDTRAGSNGCDSVTTLNLTVNQSATSTDNQSICSSALPYSWNGQSLTTAGTYTNTTTGSNGCDSVATLNLTVNATSTGSETLSGPAPFSWNGSSYTTSGVYYYTTTNALGCDSVVTLNLTISAPSIATVNLTAFIQGYYNGSGMVAARYDNLTAAGSLTPGNATDVDFVTVELHDALNTATVAYTADGMLQTDGTLTVQFPAAAVGNDYYVVLKHQSSLQLWSANAITISSTTAYDFSTSLSQAFTDGSTDPMAFLATGVYGMYSGDINQDEYIDGSDYSVYEIDVDNSTNGGVFNLASDLNGDTYVDGSDYPLFDINSANSVYSQHP